MPAESESRPPRASVARDLGVLSGDAARWSRIKAVFLEAIELPDGERALFLARACVDDTDLKEAVESLLASDEVAASFGEVPAAELLGPSMHGERVAAPRLPPGTRLGPYQLIAFVAAGGMGEVYRARHTLLGREVAIKVVGGGGGSAESSRRLLREARNASVLAHPNICRVYDVGEAEGAPFIAMEFVEGRPLSVVLRERAFPLTEVLSCGASIADALAHAHERGIVHRDLKSSNIVLRPDGQPIVLDFGLARRVVGPDASGVESTLTQQHALAGTLSHMAPEVLLGSRGDARSDVWALGVVLHELATGELPFPGRTPFETSSAILNDPPRTPARRVPLALSLVIDRCLAKDPVRRFPRARDVHAALEAIRRRNTWPLVGTLLVSAHPWAWFAGAVAAVLLPLLIVSGAKLAGRARAGPPVSTVALLPLENAGHDRASSYYAAGVTDALTAQLGAASVVRVVSPASVVEAKRAGGSLAEMGRRLGADALVEGSVRREARRVVLNLRMTSATSGQVLWAHRFERAPRDALALEAEAVGALTQAVRRPLRPGTEERLSRVRAVSPEVYEEYLKGRYEWNQRTAGSLKRAVAHFNAAVALDPSYAPAHASLADCYNQLGTVMLGEGSPREWRPQAIAEAIKALQIDPSSAEAHAALGYAWHYDWHWADAERELRRALELNPSFALAHVWYANLLSSLGRNQEAVQQARTARELDPFSLVVNTNLAWTLQMAGQHEQAVVAARSALALDSTYIQAHWRLAQSLAALGRYPDALAEYRRAVDLSHGSSPALAELAESEVAARRLGEARVIADDLVARSRREYVPPWALANLLAKLGREDEALAWMRRAVDEHSNGIAYTRPGLMKGPLAADPRFRLLLAPVWGR